MKNTYPFITHIYNFIEKQQLIAPDSTLIMGLSGGPDSMFLLHILHEYAQQHQVQLIAAHLNHQWRAEADSEQELCRQSCATIGITFHGTTLAQITTATYNGSKEAYARTARRIFFEQLKKQYNAHAIALAHHAQDQQETFFVRLIRGAGLPGLTAIKAKHSDYIRPLLQTNKRDILTYLHENNIAYATDSSNESNDYLRNRIRNQVIPALYAADERFENNFVRTLLQLQETEQFLEELTQNYYNEVVISSENDHLLNLEKYDKLNTNMKCRVLLKWLIINQVQFTPTASFFNEIHRFIDNTHSKSHQLHLNWTLVKNNKKLIIKTI